MVRDDSTALGIWIPAVCSVVAPFAWDGVAVDDCVAGRVVVAHDDVLVAHFCCVVGLFLCLCKYVCVQLGDGGESRESVLCVYLFDGGWKVTLLCVGDCGCSMGTL